MPPPTHRGKHAGPISAGASSPSGGEARAAADPALATQPAGKAHWCGLSLRLHSLWVVPCDPTGSGGTAPSSLAPGRCSPAQPRTPSCPFSSMLLFSPARTAQHAGRCFLTGSPPRPPLCPAESLLRWQTLPSPLRLRGILVPFAAARCACIRYRSHHVAPRTATPPRRAPPPPAVAPPPSPAGSPHTLRPRQPIVRAALHDGHPRGVSATPAGCRRWSATQVVVDPVSPCWPRDAATDAST